MLCCVSIERFSFWKLRSKRAIVVAALLPAGALDRSPCLNQPEVIVRQQPSHFRLHQDRRQELRCDPPPRAVGRGSWRRSNGPDRIIDGRSKFVWSAAKSRDRSFNAAFAISRIVRSRWSPRIRASRSSVAKQRSRPFVRTTHPLLPNQSIERIISKSEPLETFSAAC